MTSLPLDLTSTSTSTIASSVAQKTGRVDILGRLNKYRNTSKKKLYFSIPRIHGLGREILF